MTITEEFKIAVKTGQFKRAFLLVLSQAFNLTITTSIEEVTIKTNLNLLEGEINNQIQPGFLEQESRSLVEKFHFNQVNLAPELVIQYLKNWQDLAQIYANWDQDLVIDAERDLPSLPQESFPEEEWSEFPDEAEEKVKNVEVIKPKETTERKDNEDWGEWMEEEEVQGD